jgi:hypothetical protein
VPQNLIVTRSGLRIWVTDGDIESDLFDTLEDIGEYVMSRQKSQNLKRNKDLSKFFFVRGSNGSIIFPRGTEYSNILLGEILKRDNSMKLEWTLEPIEYRAG